MNKMNFKVANFYGNNVPRPFLIMDEDGESVKDRVDVPKVNDALIGKQLYRTGTLVHNYIFYHGECPQIGLRKSLLKTEEGSLNQVGREVKCQMSLELQSK